MSKARKIIVPAAAIAATSQAMMAIQPTVEQISVATKSSEYDLIALTAVSTARGQEIVRSAQTSIVRAMRIDKDILNRPYSEVAEENDNFNPLLGINPGETVQNVVDTAGGLPTDATTEHLMDSSSAGESYFSCYSNCHSACHGSRGWR